MDAVDEHIEKYGLMPQNVYLDEIREILKDQISKERQRQGDGNTELMKLCCVQLFSQKRIEDIFLIWSAKTSSMDADSSIDVQLLCSNGVDVTKAYLKSIETEQAKNMLDRIEESIQADDFKGFSFEKQMADYEYYYQD